MWTDEGISLATQAEFGIAYDPYTNYIVIPIFDSIGSLVGAKGRLFGEPDEYHPKYQYIEKCNKSRVLYGYWQNREFIKNNKYIIVVESEKSVLKLAEYGYRNAVSTGGKTISKCQVELITRTSCIPVFAFDKDVQEDELQDIADMFMDGVNVYAVIDTDNLLGEKESPMDRQDVWSKLYKDCVFKLK
jgi:DNA primase